MFKTVILSDNQPCKVRVLGLYELDGKGREVLGPYRYSILLATGQVYEAEYDLGLLTKTPVPPETPAKELSPDSWEWNQLKEYETYIAALAHEKLRLESYEGYLSDIAHYILDNCLDETDRIVTPDDWRKVQAAAIVPALTEEVIADTLRDVFQGVI